MGTTGLSSDAYHAGKFMNQMHPWSQAGYQQILYKIQNATTHATLHEAMDRLLKEIGFGPRIVFDPETGEEIHLDYFEIAECLKETDPVYFQKPIELLLLAQERSYEISQGIAPRKPEPEIPPWQHLL